MSSLLSYAQILAADPPTEVFREIRRWDAVQNNNQNYQDEWQVRCHDYGEVASTYFVGAICDMTAMSMMMVAAGVQRIEAMKATLRNLQANQTGRLIGEENSADRGYCYRQQNQADDFEELLTNWCAGRGGSVVQLKFKGNGDWHTFCIERIQTDNRAPQFVLYQSYQNTYRLKDFLGLGSQAEQESHMGVVWAHASEGDKLSYGNSLVRFTQGNIARIGTTARYLGGGEKIDTNTLRQRVITPLKGMLAGDIQNAPYVSMTGSHLRGRARASAMAVLICDNISPDEFRQNYADLRKAQGLTMYPDFGN